MLSSIQTLPPEVVNLIAAGEVIDSMAAVVRELVENSLDAGANRIVISLFPDVWRIQVADNGCGMSLTNLRQCAKPHSTSKIRHQNDLGKITSLGFRGEALHSISQVAGLEILSRSCLDDSNGWHLFFQKGEVVREEIIAIASGTIVNVVDLFGNLPVRRKGLPSIAQQLKEVQKTVAHIALCHPYITWQLYQNDKLWFSISAGNTPQDILPQILKRVHYYDLQFLELDIDTTKTLDFTPAKLKLVLGLPDRCHRVRADWVKVAVNRRVVKAPELEQTILSSLIKTLPGDRFPVCFLHLQIFPSQIDWNRHPSKTEIYLHNLQFWREQTAIAIEQILRISPTNLPIDYHNQRVSKLLKTAENKGKYDLERSIINRSSDDISLIELRAVAQVNNTYIVAEHSTGLWLIEQHIAHERVLYEKLQDNWKIMTLKTPIIVSHLTPIQIEQLQRLELEIEPFGEELWAIRTLPEMLSKRDDCTDALIELSLGGNLNDAQVAVACRSAIRNNTPLNIEQMQTLLDNWKITRNPRTCPHGRPIYLSLEETALARFFRRHWVLGKSHGI